MFFDSHYLLDLFPQIIKAFPITFFIVIVSTIAGLLLGLLLAIIRLEKVPLLNQLTIVYTSFIQGTPVIVQLFIVYYGVPYLLSLVGIDTSGVSKLTFMYIAYSLNTAAYMGEIIRASIANVPQNQFDAAYSLGMTKVQTYKNYIIPQAIKEILPNLELSIVSLLQNSSLATYLGIYDIMGKAQLVGANTAHQIEANLDAAFIFIVLSIAIHIGFKVFLQNEESADEVSDHVIEESVTSQLEPVKETIIKKGELSYE
ncbi:amino acid ABC transporter permease [Streptococcus loxodontisalivarius]|uniref:L-cystine transport system permease protein n=1 Tax=Streptococcus loxodontisalivarius TaxID=1349415 RepID=A0ABS2PRM3_9STRE|nr:amino acid ABC transporter permease [Streptococcus loxodontisalivarius]MBM7642672.1 L-cystine transport system permease protein [Streptococcus loxodontisalivarius]